MDTQTESKLVVKIAKTPLKTENPMQERHCGDVAESVMETAEAVFSARRSEVRDEAGPIFVP